MAHAPRTPGGAEKGTRNLLFRIQHPSMQLGTRIQIQTRGTRGKLRVPECISGHPPPLLTENPDFVLNKPAYRKAKILVAGDNFGCGSSREHAPWALMDFGIRCVISTSFGDIFYNNCFKNGVLPIKVSREDLNKLFDDADRGANATLTIDLEERTIKGPD